MKKIAFLLWLIYLPSKGCNISIQGKVIDEHDNSILAYSEIIYKDSSQIVIADSNGFFEINNLCKGAISLVIYHLGCNPKKYNLILEKDTTITLFLEHHEELLNEIVILGNQLSKENTQSLDKTILSKNSKSLGEIALKIPGLSAQISGPNIYKPAINGLFGDRIAIIYNNIVLRSQDWGTEHAPELDISNANNIHILKGAKMLQFASNTLGGIIAINDLSEFVLNTLTYKTKSAFSTNGLGILNTNHFTVSKYIKDKVVFKYALQGTFRINRDYNTKNYNILNTSSISENFSTIMNFNEQIKNSFLKSTVYYSYLKNNIGIMRNAHIGNINDLQNVIFNNIPFYIDKNNYKIDNPKQDINHQIISIQNQLNANNKEYTLGYTFQIDRRKEFDIRRSNRSDIPALDMKLFSHHIQMNMEFKKNSWKYKFGLDEVFFTNNNTENLGVKPIVPNYIKNSSALYASASHEFNKKSQIQSSIRFQNDFLKAYKFDIDNKIYTPSKSYLLFNFQNTFTYFIENLDFVANLGFNRRAPNIAELFSQGLHHGTATLEYGNEYLKPENAVIFNFDINVRPTYNWSFNILPYVYYINDYVFLKPQPLPIQTIRGAFYAYNYVQANAYLYGADFINTISFFENFLNVKSQYSINGNRESTLKGNLPNMPQPKLSNTFSINKKIKNDLHQINYWVAYDYFFKQKKINTAYEIVATPAGYGLLSSGMELDFNYKNHNISLNLLAENIFNIKFKNYSDRFRYFSDGLGTNITISVIYTTKKTIKS